MEDIYKAPDWLCKPANLDFSKLPQIQFELIKLLKLKVPDFTKATSQFIVPGGNIETTRKTCPTLMEELERLELAHMLKMIAMIMVTPDHEYPIHIDSTNPARMSVALNMPVLNCQNSYTIWYDAKIQYEQYVPEYVIGDDIAWMAVPCDSNNAVEIARCDANVPHWVNIYRPHVPKCDHTMFRVNASLRFTADIYKVIYSDDFESKYVKS